MKYVCILLAAGFEEVEALVPADYLRRAGLDVKLVCVTSPKGKGPAATGSHGIQVVADIDDVRDAGDYDALVIPGGMPGSSNIAASSEARALILRHFHAGKLIAAICAAPAVVLHGGCGILEGRKFTGYPGTEAQVSGAFFSAGRVVEDANLITARAAGCAAEFSFAIIRYLVGEEAAAKVAAAVLER